MVNCGKHGFMDRSVITRRILAFFIAMGVVLSPLATPFSSMAIAVQVQAMPAVDMPDDMPCCPKKTPSPFHCQKCVFATCMMKYSQATLSSECLGGAALVSVIAPGDDALPAGLDRPPPDHPPRTSL
jgi:hypothetical protein